jgi:hypothetical protein
MKKLFFRGHALAGRENWVERSTKLSKGGERFKKMGEKTCKTFTLKMACLPSLFYAYIKIIAISLDTPMEIVYICR